MHARVPVRRRRTLRRAQGFVYIVRHAAPQLPLFFQQPQQHSPLWVKRFDLMMGAVDLESR